MLNGTFLLFHAFLELSRRSTGSRVIRETRDILAYTEVLRKVVKEIESSLKSSRGKETWKISIPL